MGASGLGQLRETGSIFLSAGVPDPNAKHFVGEGDTAAITSAVSALLYVTLGRRPLVWGGHPAITPMVWSVAEAMDVDYGAWVKLYQSLVFQDEFPEETAKFQNVVFTDAVAADIPASLGLMRRRMIEEADFQAAVFIGGMAGVLEEFDLIGSVRGHTKIIPVASTGGAALILDGKLGKGASADEELDYVSLFHRQLEIDPNELRYRTPNEQPAKISDRIIIPSSSTSS